MSRLIRDFFAVTQHSIYWIRRDVNGTVVVSKFAHRNHAQGDRTIGDTLPTDDLWAITLHEGIFSFHADIDAIAYEKVGSNSQVLPEHVPQSLWNKGTSPLIALCTTPDQAKSCLADGSTDIDDVRWKRSTKNVLRQLEDDPKFRVSRLPGLGFPVTFFEQ